MKRTYFILTTLLLTIGFGCISCHKAEEKEADITTKSQVEVTHISHKDMRKQTTVFAISSYLKKYAVSAPLTGFINNITIRRGQRIRKGQVLYTLETQERNSISNNNFLQDSTMRDYGKLEVKAPSDGIISAVQKPQAGDYVQKGNALATISQPGSLVFSLKVPYEYARYLEQNKSCEIILPDSTKLKGTITAALTAMSAGSQTQEYQITPQKQIFLPEGLMAEVTLTIAEKLNAQVLPRPGVLSDEVQQNFWVMKLINDSTAVKVPVRPGIMNDEEIEITSPRFSDTARILSSGNYGLEDTALVNIQ